MSKSSSFSQALQFITSIKLQELEKQRLAYKKHTEVIERANATGDDYVAKVEILLEGVRSWTGSGSVTEFDNIGGKLNLSNIKYWLKQAKNDPSFSPDIARGWADTLETHIRHNMMRFDCARLFGTLFNEWLSSGDSSTVTYQSSAEDAATEASFDESEFVNEGRKELYEQRERLESIIFQDKPIDKVTLTKYLEGLFTGEEGEKAFAILRRTIKTQGDAILLKRLNPQDVKNTIRGLLVTGLMDEEKRATLNEFLNNDTVIKEVASVLNMRLADLQNWSWPAEGILVEMRRHLNGKYRAFTDPEIIDALLLHYLGITWQVNLRRALTGVYHSKAWKGKGAEVPRLETEKRVQQLPSGRTVNSIVTQRNRLRESLFFLSQLSDTMGTTKEYDDVVDGDSSFDSDSPGGGLSPVQIKQKLLHIMTTENYLNTALRGSFAVIRSDLEWFGPSLSHEAILTVLEFFGFNEKWLSFFKTFLQAPLRFAHDKEPQVRKCGTPIGYSLSTVCGEAVLFGLDLTVNQKVDGLFLQRLHDDFWVWDSDASKCAAAWKEMNTYAQLAGLTFNKEKTGSAYVGNGSPKGLPSGVIRWGFLRFDASKARFVIDQKEVDTHIAELKRQLAFTKSVFGWVNAYNKYMAFFLRNFGGRPANCFGEAHVEDIVQTLARIQRELFPGNHDSAVGHLRSVIEQRFDVKNLPEGYFYSPIGSGGLELRNTMLEVLAIPQTLREFPIEETFTRAIKMDEVNYKVRKEVWELGYATPPEAIAGPLRRRMIRQFEDTPKFDEFFTYEEYISNRETWLDDWSNAYQKMLEVPELVPMGSSPALDAMLAGSRDKSWMSMNWYDRWITSLYGEELVKKFGGLAIVDPTLIPVGMVQLFRSSRMKLDQ